MNQESSVSIVTGLTPGDREMFSFAGNNREFFSSTKRQDPPNLLLRGHVGLSSRGNSGGGVEVTTNLHLVSKLSRGGGILPLPIRHYVVNPLKPELNPICYLLAILGAHHFLHVSRIRVKLLTFRLLMSYIYGEPILDVSRSHTTTQHSR